MQKLNFGSFSAKRFIWVVLLGRIDNAHGGFSAIFVMILTHFAIFFRDSVTEPKIGSYQRILQAGGFVIFCFEKGSVLQSQVDRREVRNRSGLPRKEKRQ